MTVIVLSMGSKPSHVYRAFYAGLPILDKRIQLKYDLCGSFVHVLFNVGFSRVLRLTTCPMMHRFVVT